MTMRLAFPDRQSAQTVADRIYADMQAANALEPATTAWAIPVQDTDENGNPIGTEWFVAVDARCAAFLTEAEVAQVPELQMEAI